MRQLAVFLLTCVVSLVLLIKDGDNIFYKFFIIRNGRYKSFSPFYCIQWKNVNHTTVTK